MEQDLGEEWVVVPRDGSERSTTDHKVEDLRGEENKTWEELVAQEERAADEAVWEGHKWRKYV